MPDRSGHDEGRSVQRAHLDHKSGAVAKDEWIAEADDLKAAQAQAAAMAKAKLTLDVAIFAHTPSGQTLGYRPSARHAGTGGRPRPVAVSS